MFSGFQANAYQSNAYQIISGQGNGIVYGGGGYYDRVKHGRKTILERERLERERLEAKRLNLQAEIDAKEAQVAAIEVQRLDDLANQQLQLELMAALQILHDMEQERLALNVLIMQFMREDDDLLALMYCIPFMA